MNLTCWVAQDGHVWIEDRLSESETEVYAKVEPAHDDVADLFAAAPDLLEALQILLVQVPPYKDGDGAAMCHAQNIARAAIAKATGEAQPPDEPV